MSSPSALLTHSLHLLTLTFNFLTCGPIQSGRGTNSIVAQALLAIRRRMVRGERQKDASLSGMHVTWCDVTEGEGKLLLLLLLLKQGFREIRRKNR
jgi:hypothetical protein